MSKIVCSKCGTPGHNARTCRRETTTTSSEPAKPTSAGPFESAIARLVARRDEKLAEAAKITEAIAALEALT